MSVKTKGNIYIIGAGIAGISIAREIKARGIFGRVAAFMDDDPAKIGKKINGIPVTGPIEDVVTLLHPLPGDEAIIAVPSSTRDQLRRIHALLRSASFSRILILPRISQILEGEAHLIQAREINPEDLLTREPVRVSLKASLGYVRGKRVLITGAGGSIGSELARQLLSGGAQRLYLFGHGENSIYEIEKELKLLQEEGVGEKATIVPIIGELQDREYIRFLFKRLKADVVFHTAAHKHVPLMEHNPVEVIKNNVFGTRNLLEGAIEGEVSRFILISTDKAVDPGNIYGASKFLAEELCHKVARGKTKTIVVRFGNVLGSRGSILPLFRTQILKGGPVTVTHPETSRYFMTIPEASSLVLKAGGLDVEREIFVLDMGNPVLIRKLAEQLIRFYGYTPGKEISIEFTGLRPGEKLTEKLWSSREKITDTQFPKIRLIEKINGGVKDLDKLIEELRPVCYFSPEKENLFRSRRRLKEILSQYLDDFKVSPDEPEY